VLTKLERLVDETVALHTRLVLVCGPSGSGKTDLLRQLGQHVNAPVVSLGSALGRRLVPLSRQQRSLQAVPLLRAIAEQGAAGGTALLDNLEVLFDATLALNPISLVRRLAQRRTVVATWPGELRNGHLTYAKMGHPEHRDYPADGLVTFELNA